MKDKIKIKNKIISVAVFLAVMVAVTGAASAFDASIVTGDPIYLQSGESTQPLGYHVEKVDPEDKGSAYNITALPIECSDINPGCTTSDVTVTLIKTKLSPIDEGTRSLSDKTLSLTEPGVLKVSMNASARDPPGTRYILKVQAGPGGSKLGLQGLASRNVLFVIPPANISGMKWDDRNANGIKDANEPRLPNWTITLKNPDGAIVKTSTDANGNYIFSNLPAGNYTVGEVLQTNWKQSFPSTKTYNVTLRGKDKTGLDFGNYIDTNISGVKFNDLNGNGVKDAGEPGLPNWTIVLKNSTVTKTTTTDATGSYIFSNLEPDNYILEEVQQAGWIQSFPAAPGTHNVNLDGVDVTGIVFGNFKLGTISGMKWNDLNGDGIKDGGEFGLANWTITLKKPDTTTVSAQTDSKGNYMFSNLLPGNYILSENMQAGWTQTAPKPVPPGIYDVTLISGQDVTDKDFGNTHPTGHPGKITGWGSLGPKAKPDLTFKLWTYSEFIPSGTVEIQDNIKNLSIKSTKIDEVITQFPVKKGFITGTATVNGKGPYSFRVDIEDNADPGATADTFIVSVSSSTEYTARGTLSAGDIQVIK